MTGTAGQARTVIVGVAMLALVAGTLPAGAAEPPPGSISGRVTDALGLPVQGVCVGVDWILRSFGAAQLVRTDALGAFSAPDVPAGAHFVTFNYCDDPAAGHAAEWWPDSPGFAEAQPVIVESGAETAGVDASLVGSGTIEGTLTQDGSGQALPGDCVAAVDFEQFALAQTRTAEDGTYAMSALAPGNYQVSFTDCTEPFHSMAEAFDDISQLDVQAGEQPKVVPVEEGATATADASLAPGGALTGTVTAAHTGETVPLACAALVAADSEQATPLFVGLAGLSPTGERLDDDRYVVGAVPAGRYVVQFLGQGCAPDGYKESWYGGATRPNADTVQLTENSTLEGVDAVLHPTPSITYACLQIEYGTFRDVAGNGPHDEAIACLTGSDVVTGKSADRYAPAAFVRRDQMASLVARALVAMGTTLPEDPPNRYSDDDGNVHETAINQMAELGIISGVGPESYGPDLLVTRAQMATLLAKAYEAATTYTLRSTRDWFIDDDGSAHQGRINHATTAGIATGVSRGQFNPSQPVRRDQVASFVARAIDRATRDMLHLFLPVAQDPGTEGGEAGDPGDSRAAAAMFFERLRTTRYALTGLSIVAR